MVDGRSKLWYSNWVRTMKRQKDNGCWAAVVMRGQSQVRMHNRTHKRGDMQCNLQNLA